MLFVKQIAISLILVFLNWNPDCYEIMTVKKKKTFKFQVILLAYSICSLAVGWESEHCTYDYQELQFLQEKSYIIISEQTHRNGIILLSGDSPWNPWST